MAPWGFDLTCCLVSTNFNVLCLRRRHSQRGLRYLLHWRSRTKTFVSEYDTTAVVTAQYCIQNIDFVNTDKCFGLAERHLRATKCMFAHSFLPDFSGSKRTHMWGHNESRHWINSGCGLSQFIPLGLNMHAYPVGCSCWRNISSRVLHFINSFTARNSYTCQSKTQRCSLPIMSTWT